MRRVDLAQTAAAALSAMPDDVHEKTLALIDSVATRRESGAGQPVAAPATPSTARETPVHLARRAGHGTCEGSALPSGKHGSAAGWWVC